MGKKGKNKASAASGMTTQEKLGANQILKWKVNSKGNGNVHYRSKKFRYEYNGKLSKGLPIDGMIRYMSGESLTEYDGKMKTILPKNKKLGLKKPEFLYTDNFGTSTHYEGNDVIRKIKGKFVNSVLKGPVTMELHSGDSKQYMKQISMNSKTIAGSNGFDRTILKPGEGETVLWVISRNGKEKMIMNASGHFNSFGNLTGIGVLNVMHVPANMNEMTILSNKYNESNYNYTFRGRFKGSNGGLIVPDGNGVKEFANGRVQIVKNGKDAQTFSSRKEMEDFVSKKNNSLIKIQSAARSKLARKTAQSRRNNLVKRNRKKRNSEMALKTIIEMSNQSNLNLQKKLRSLSKSHQKQMKTSYLNSLKNDECAICLDSFESGQFMAQTACKHKYHSHCLRDFYRQKANNALKKCPQCRANINHRRKPRTRSSLMML